MVEVGKIHVIVLILARLGHLDFLAHLMIKILAQHSRRELLFRELYLEIRESIKSNIPPKLREILDGYEEVKQVGITVIEIMSR